MKKFEYKTLNAESDYDDRGYNCGYNPVSIEVLNELGKEGWEVISAEEIGSHGLKAVLLKRQYE